MSHILPPAPRSHLPSPWLWFTPCPSAKLSQQSLGELHHHPSILGYHQTSIWAATVAWLPRSAHLSSFHESVHISCPCTQTHTLVSVTRSAGGSFESWKARVDTAEGGGLPACTTLQMLISWRLRGRCLTNVTSVGLSNHEEILDCCELCVPAQRCLVTLKTHSSIASFAMKARREFYFVEKKL